MSAKVSKWLSTVFSLTLLIIIFTQSAGAGVVLPPGGDPGGGSGGLLISVSYDKNGAFEGTVPNDNTAAVGTMVTIPGNTGFLKKTGYVFCGWNMAADGTGTAYYSGSTLTIPSSSVILYANWVKKEITFDPAKWPHNDKYYNVAYSTSDSSKNIVPTSYYYQQGNAILYKTPAEGTYAAKYNFVGFNDIQETDWSSEFVWYLSAREVVSGVSEGVFAPELSITRASFIRMLVCLTPGIDYSTIASANFNDVSDTDWFAPFINWAAANNIASGYDGKFKPNDPITREEMCKMIANYTTFIGYDLGTINQPAAFSDQGAISSWAITEVSALQQSGLITGSNNHFNPKGLTSRASAATVVCKLLMGIVSAMDNPSIIALD